MYKRNSFILVPTAQIGKKCICIADLFKKATYLKNICTFRYLKSNLYRSKHSTHYWAELLIFRKFSIRPPQDEVHFLPARASMLLLQCSHCAKCLWKQLFFSTFKAKMFPVLTLFVHFSLLVCHVLWISVLTHTVCIRSVRWHQSDSNKQWHQKISLDILLAVTE